MEFQGIIVYHIFFMKYIQDCAQNKRRLRRTLVHYSIHQCNQVTPQQTNMG